MTNGGPQNVWQFLVLVWLGIAGKTSRILSVGQALIGLALLQCIGPDGKIVDHPLVPVKYIPWMLFSVAAGQYLRAQSVSNTVSAAQAIVAQSKSTEVPLAQTVTQTIKDSQK
jgi:hypothetical protein